MLKFFQKNWWVMLVIVALTIVGIRLERTLPELPQAE